MVEAQFVVFSGRQAHAHREIIIPKVSAPELNIVHYLSTQSMFCSQHCRLRAPLLSTATYSSERKGRRAPHYHGLLAVGLSLHM